MVLIRIIKYVKFFVLVFVYSLNIDKIEYLIIFFKC